MRPSRLTARALIAAVTVLLATLLTVEFASAQVASESPRVVTSAEPHSALPSALLAEHSGTGEDDCRPRQGARHTVSVPSSTVLLGNVCGCDFRTAQPQRGPKSVTFREPSPKPRSVGLPVLHQTLRC